MELRKACCVRLSPPNVKMSLADALNTFAEAINALDARIATLERRCECCCAPADAAAAEAAAAEAAAAEAAAAEAAAAEAAAAEAAAAEAAAAEAAAFGVVLAENEKLLNLDIYGPDTIQNELWQTFRAISDEGKAAVVVYSGEYPRNIIVYADPATQPVYRNAGPAEMRIIQSMAGTLIATLQPGESVRTACVDDIWCSI